MAFTPYMQSVTGQTDSSNMLGARLQLLLQPLLQRFQPTKVAENIHP